MKKHKIQTADLVRRTEEETAELELKAEKENANQQLEEYIYNIHGKYINEDDFTGETIEQRKAAYQKFVNLYIALYYEPLDEEYDEARYFTPDFDENLFKKMKYNRQGSSKKISSISVIP